MAEFISTLIHGAKHCSLITMAQKLYRNYVFISFIFLYTDTKLTSQCRSFVFIDNLAAMCCFWMMQFTCNVLLLNMMLHTVDLLTYCEVKDEIAENPLIQQGHRFKSHPTQLFKYSFHFSTIPSLSNSLGSHIQIFAHFHYSSDLWSFPYRK